VIGPWIDTIKAGGITRGATAGATASGTAATIEDRGRRMTPELWWLLGSSALVIAAGGLIAWMEA
jgi:hypothetical protein